MRDMQTIAPANLRLIGGEMLGWSDEQGRGARGGRAFDPLLGAVANPGAHVLVAGPHDRLLVKRLLGHGAKVTCLLRSYPDSISAGKAAGARARRADAARPCVGVRRECCAADGVATAPSRCSWSSCASCNA